MGIVPLLSGVCNMLAILHNVRLAREFGPVWVMGNVLFPVTDWVWRNTKEDSVINRLAWRLGCYLVG